MRARRRGALVEIARTPLARASRGVALVPRIVQRVIGYVSPHELPQSAHALLGMGAITVTSTGPLPNGSQGLPMLVKPPRTDDLLATAKEVLQLRDEPSSVLIGKFRESLGAGGVRALA